MKSALRDILLFICYIFGVHRIIRRYQKNDLTILLYHGVTPEVGSGIFNYRRKFVAPKVFEMHLKYLKKHFTILPLDEAIERFEAKTLPPHALSITFDDGYKNNVTHGARILKKYDLPSTVFIVTNFVDQKTPLWVDRLEYAIGHGTKHKQASYKQKVSVDEKRREEMKRMKNDERLRILDMTEEENEVRVQDSDVTYYDPMDWSDIKKAENMGMTFGAHTKSHPIMSNISLHEAEREIEDSLNLLKSHTKKASSVFAYPNGQQTDFNEEIKGKIEKLGFSAALTTISGSNSYGEDLYELKRYTMDGAESMISFTMRVTGTLDVLRNIFKR